MRVFEVVRLSEMINVVNNAVDQRYGCMAVLGALVLCDFVIFLLGC